MTRPVNLARPIRCSKCGEKFARTRGNQRRCEKCMPLRLKLPKIIAAAEARRRMADGSDCQYPACGHRLAERAVDLASGTCRPRSVAESAESPPQSANSPRETHHAPPTATNNNR